MFLLICTVFTTWGAVFSGRQITSALPVFSCAYVPSSGAIGICKTLTTFSLTLVSGAGTALLSVLGAILVCAVGILLFGRLWCGYVCPFGFYQEILSIVRRKLRIPGVQMPETLKPVLRVTKWIFLLFLLLGIGFCNLCPVRFIMPALAGYGSQVELAGLVLTGILTAVCFFRERFFCWICPMGSLMGLANKKSLGRIKKEGSACTHCRVCLEHCPMDIELIYTERELKDVTHSDCIFCMKCIEACPEPDALSFTILNKKILTSKRDLR